MLGGEGCAGQPVRSLKHLAGPQGPEPGWLQLGKSPSSAACSGTLFPTSVSPEPRMCVVRAAQAPGVTCVSVPSFSPMYRL